MKGIKRLGFASEHLWQKNGKPVHQFKKPHFIVNTKTHMPNKNSANNNETFYHYRRRSQCITKNCRIFNNNLWVIIRRYVLWEKRIYC